MKTIQPKKIYAVALLTALILLVGVATVMIVTSQHTKSESKEAGADTEMAISKNYTVKGFDIVDKAQGVIEVTYDNDGVDATIQVLFDGVDIEKYYSMKNQTLIKTTMQMERVYPNQIRFSPDLDEKIRSELHK